MPKRKSKKPTKLEKEYTRLRENYLRNIRSLEKRGYFAEKEFEKPSTAKELGKVTRKDISNIKKLNEERYQQYSYVNPETGEVVGGNKGRFTERKVKAKQRTEDYGNFNFYDEIAERLRKDFPSSRTFYSHSKRGGFTLDTEEELNELLNIWRNTYSTAIENETLSELNKYIKSKTSDIARCVEVVASDSDGGKVTAAIAELANILRWETPLTEEQNDRLEEQSLML